MLRKEINTLQLWGIAVGMVISGEYFGWNYGWAVSGTVGFLFSTLLVTVLYITFIFSYTELTAALPEAGGPFVFAERAFGKTGGFIAGFATLVDFLLAPPAIAMALGSYAHFLLPPVPVLPVSVGMYVVFIAFNLLGIKEAARFSLLITLLSVGEIVLYLALIAPHFKADNFLVHNPPLSVSAVFAGLPYAVWFFVAIEGVAMVAEEVRNPQKTIPKGYLLSLLTLVLLTLGILVLSSGMGDWRQLAHIDHPLPQTLAMIFGQDSGWAKIFTGLGLFGLISSFHGNTIGYSRQIFALSRGGLLPGFLSRLNCYGSPYWALLAGGGVGLLAMLTLPTEAMIVLSVLGAVVMYGVSMLSLLHLRRQEPDLVRPFRTPFYPVFPIIALLLTVLCTVAITFYNLALSGLFFGGMAVSGGVYYRIRKDF
jgi:ethanolamine permease